MPDRLDPILSAEGMRAADRATIHDRGVPGRVLMETAGRAAADAICARVPIDGASVLVLAGHGNNGGDAFVVARVLAARGARVSVYTTAVDADGTPHPDLTPDARANLDLLDRIGTISLGLPRPLPANAAVIVDGLLGIGASGPLRGPIGRVCERLDGLRRDALVVALDVPTGLDATTGEAAEHAVRADLTVAFGALKGGLVQGRGPALAGEVVTAEIGIPAREFDTRAVAHRPTPGWVASRLPRRAPDAHKYSAGRALCVVGSRAFTGAAVLATGAAARAGAGAVVCAAPQSAGATVDAGRTEVMVARQPETDTGTLAITAYDGIVERLDSADAVLIGCGLGRAVETQRLVRALLRRIETPLVLDADGLRAFEGDTDAFVHHDAPLVLTPHLGELRALVGDAAWDPADRIEAVRDLAARWGAVVVFKGMPSLVGTPDGRVLVGPPPEPALATAGTGDVLAGTVVGLLAQGLAPDVAAVAALHLGTAAVAVAAERLGPDGLLAHDLVDALPAARVRLQ